jgi:hypothetical protein
MVNTGKTEQDHLRQVTRAFEDLVTVGTLLVNVHRRSILLAASHGALNALINCIVKVDSTLDGARRNGRVHFVRLSSQHGNGLSVLHYDKLKRLSVLGNAMFQVGLLHAMSYFVVLAPLRI